MFMVMLVLNDPAYLDPLLAAWSAKGVSGVTIVESTGMYHRLKHIPMRYAYDSKSLVEEGNVTLFAIVPDEALVMACAGAAEKIVGDLCEPNTGVFASWPLSVVKGVPPRQSG